MKPNEHEYKVMGLAPYGEKLKKFSKVYQILTSTMYVEGIRFKYKVLPNDYFFWFKKNLMGKDLIKLLMVFKIF